MLFSIAISVLLPESLCLASSKGAVASWAGNTREWNERLGVTELRLGCSGLPRDCLNSVRRHSRKSGVDRVMLALSGEAGPLIVHAAQYSASSLSEPALSGIGIDDLVRTLERWTRASSEHGSAERSLKTMIDNTKSKNPTLRFGVTVYEDELSSRTLQEIPAETRKRVDRVTLYVHYRRNGARYRSYVAKTRKLFPRSEIFGGVYAYDRIDYLPCAERRRSKCSVREEIDLFKRLFLIQASMLENDEIAGIEFYPGYFGIERDWVGWSGARGCQPTRRHECVDVTLEMRSEAVTILDGIRSTARKHNVGKQ